MEDTYVSTVLVAVTGQRNESAGEARVGKKNGTSRKEEAEYSLRDKQRDKRNERNIKRRKKKTKEKFLQNCCFSGTTLVSKGLLTHLDTTHDEHYKKIT